MNGEDLLGRFRASTDGELLLRLRSARRGRYRSFALWHAEKFPALFLHLNEDIAYIHYFPRDDHAGFQASGMPLGHCPDSVHFLGLGGEPESFEMTSDACLECDVAIAAAVEFLRDPALPPSIRWVEL